MTAFTSHRYRRDSIIKNNLSRNILARNITFNKNNQPMREYKIYDHPFSNFPTTLLNLDKKLSDTFVDTKVEHGSRYFHPALLRVCKCVRTGGRDQACVHGFDRARIAASYARCAYLTFSLPSRPFPPYP